MIKVVVMCIAHDDGDRLGRLKICAEHFSNSACADHDVEFNFALCYDTEKVREIVEQSAFPYTYKYGAIPIPNNIPLAERHNRMLSHLMNAEWDYLMQIGSDDVITHVGYRTAANWMMQGCRFGAFTKLAIVNKDRTKMKYHQGLGNMGAGRFIRRDVVELVLKNRHLWPPKLIKGLDGNSELNVAEVTGVQVHPINTYLPCVFDFKGDINLHPYTKFTGKERDFDMGMIK